MKLHRDSYTPCIPGCVEQSGRKSHPFTAAKSYTRYDRFLDFMFGLGKLPTRWSFINPLQSMHKLIFVALLAYSVDYLP